MKFICPSCERTLELISFYTEGAVLVVDCQECKAVTRVDPVSEEVITGTVLRTPPRPVAALNAPIESTVRTSPGKVTVYYFPAKPKPKPPADISLDITETPTLATVEGASGGSEIALSTAASEAAAKANEAAHGDPFAVPAGFCPKCITPKPEGAPACAQCGLTFDKFEPSSVVVSDWLTGTWKALLTRWGDESAHADVMKQAAGKDELAQVGRLYRLRLASVPQDPFAIRGRDEVLRLAVVPQLVAAAVPREAPKTPAWQYVMALMVVAACLVAIFYMARTFLGGRAPMPSAPVEEPAEAQPPLPSGAELIPPGEEQKHEPLPSGAELIPPKEAPPADNSVKPLQ